MNEVVFTHIFTLCLFTHITELLSALALGAASVSDRPRASPDGDGQRVTEASGLCVRERMRGSDAVYLELPCGAPSQSPCRSRPTVSFVEDFLPSPLSSFYHLEFDRLVSHVLVYVTGENPGWEQTAWTHEVHR